MPNVNVMPASTDKATNTASTPNIGDVMPAGHAHAGWIYAGISNTTGKPLYAASKDSGVMEWSRARDFAAKRKSKLPTPAELDQLSRARNEGALKGTFNESGATATGWYWSSVRKGDHAWSHRFSDKTREWTPECVRSAVRLVRS
jgi:hypothetical protein